MELSLVGLQNAGKTSLVNTIAVSEWNLFYSFWLWVDFSWHLVILCFPDRGIQWRHDSNCGYLFPQIDYLSLFWYLEYILLLVINFVKPGWVQYAKSYEGKCDNQALGPWRTKEVSFNVGALLPWCHCDSVMPLVFDLLSLWYKSIICWFLTIHLSATCF